MDFIKNDKHFSRYYEGMYILFNTGLRISEFVGLVKSDIDFENGKIKVDHQLQRKRDMEYVIEDTKTSSGERYVPMTDEVQECFKRIIENRKNSKIEPVIDGYTGFLYLDKLPKITPHVCQHTFCSNMAKSGMNPKTLQYIMGHSDIGVTLNTYTHVNYEDAQREMKRVHES